MSTCGSRTYVITDDTGAVPTWVTAVAHPTDATKFNIRVAIDTESYVKVHTLTIKVGFTDYPVSADALHPTKDYTVAVTVVAAACDCSLITWNEPENLPLIMDAMVVTTPATQTLLEAGPLQSSLTSTSGARACDHANDECNYAYTIQAQIPGGSNLPSWLVYTRPNLVATPVLAEHIGIHYVELVQVRSDASAVKTVYKAAKITVGCTILTWTAPTMPTQTEASYTIFGADMTIKLAPEFTQQPPCAYTADMSFKWTIPSGSPIYSTSDPYSLLVTSANVKNEGIYTVFLDNTIVYDGTSWNERVSYDITIVNPCLATTLFAANTTIAAIDYNIGDATATHKFTSISDTISNAATTGGNCGTFVYSLVSNDTAVGTPFVQVIDLLNAKGLQVYTESEKYAGNYTISMNVYMKEQP